MASFQKNLNDTDLQKLLMKCYYPDEVRRISVQEIEQINSFDEAGFPLRGGFYDPVLGPSERAMNCGTCGLPDLWCPGHFGHIQLSVPLFNPLFYMFTFHLTKGTCLHCHRFTYDTSSTETLILMAQIRAIGYGATEVLDSLAGYIQDKIKNDHDVTNFIVDQTRTDKKSRQNAEWGLLNEMDKAIAELSGLESPVELQSRGMKSLTKNSVDMRSQIITRFLRENLFKVKTRCNHCKKVNGKLRNDLMRAFLIDFTGMKMIDKTKIEEIGLRLSTSNIKKTGSNSKKRQLIATELILRENPNNSKQSTSDDEENFDRSKFNKTPEASNISQDGLLDPFCSAQQLASQLNLISSGKCVKLIWRAAEVREHLRILWSREKTLLKVLFPIFDEIEHNDECALDILFIDTLLVQPPKYRPIKYFDGSKFEHPTTTLLKKILEASQLLMTIKMLQSSIVSMPMLAKELIEQKVAGKTLSEKLHNAYMDLQLRLNLLYDQAHNRLEKHPLPGLRQILEKKAGIFRMHMMGKRVNYACRSVITPDPYLNIDEIGIPVTFAKKLTFEEPINRWNKNKLKKLVHRGPTRYPGANFIASCTRPGTKLLLTHDNKERDKQWKSLMEIRKKLSFEEQQQNQDYVYRHLKRGDSLLMNRQPSLHKPSIMGHRARVLMGQNALRMNYAPCKAYNADFDGDEMNGHFVQNRVAQCEAAELANVASNFLVPKDGTPILGLIQDHVVSGVLMTIRGRFFTREDFMHLVLAAFAQTNRRLKIPPPTVLKPVVLWSGKQVITAIIQNCCPAGQPLINLNGKAKTPVACWKARDKHGNEMPAPDFIGSESEVIFRHGELLCGVLDKAHYGTTQYGLIHCCYELYGSRVAAEILSCFSRVFTTYLQFHGFTLGVADILVTKQADLERRQVIREIRQSGEAIARKTFSVPDSASKQTVQHSLESAYNNPREDVSGVKYFDYCTKQAMAKFNERINNACVPSGLIRSFPENGLQMMIQSGAKGSSVNAIQISCALGQIELEGQRPPRSVVGRSLPSFSCFDSSPRAGGFVDQRFLTGINPQELFFHTMAGREGLIDTAVKTSRSGYLQRCIIKHLEGIVACYDQTVRDHDGGIIQFRYGEDGLDVGRATFLDKKQFHFLEQNAPLLYQKIASSCSTQNEDCVEQRCEVEKHFKQVRKFKRRKMELAQRCATTQKHLQIDLLMPINKLVSILRESAFLNFCCKRPGVHNKDTLIAEWQTMSAEQRSAFKPKHSEQPEPVDVKFNMVNTLGALPEHLLEECHDFAKCCASSDEFKKAFYWRGLRSLVEPGECVGLLAAQSIGEPSTQMTLNTFHFAGRGEMNVTLGIPRLREILMSYGTKISTPMAEIQIRDNVTDAEIEKLKNELNPVMFKDLVKRFVIEERILSMDGQLWRQYTLKLVLLRSSLRDPSVRHISHHKILVELERRFGKLLAVAIGKRVNDIRAFQSIQHKKLNAGNLEFGAGRNANTESDETMTISSAENRKKRKDDEEESSGDEVEDVGEKDASEARLSSRHQDDAAEYEGEEQDKDEQPEKEADEEDLQTTVVGSDEESQDHGYASKEDGGGEDMTLEEAEMDAEKDAEKALKKAKEEDRITEVLESHALITGYSFDVNKERWCQFKYRIPMFNRTKLDVFAIVEKEVEKFVLSQVPKVEKCIVREDKRNGRQVQILQTQGINLDAFYSRSTLLDVNSIYSNDINLMLTTYGIEACARTITKEMNNVFGVYGIEVNPRHLTLTSDYMTFTGAIKPFNRGAMADSASPLQKMTFETTVTFMRDAILKGEEDQLTSPSSRLVVGRQIRGGTGAFDVIDVPTKNDW